MKAARRKLTLGPVVLAFTLRDLRISGLLNADITSVATTPVGQRDDHADGPDDLIGNEDPQRNHVTA
jgi:hypothetical protein